VSEVSINLGGTVPRMVVVHFYDATGGMLGAEVVVDPANMQVRVPYGAAMLVTTWEQDDDSGEPVIMWASMPVLNAK
jgi:hypothetical protein